MTSSALPVPAGAGTRELQALFAAARCPELTEVIGRSAAEVVGPGLVRVLAPLAFRLTGLGDWWGKELAPVPGDPLRLAGHNLAGPEGRRRTIALTASIAPSRADGRPAVVVAYPPDARLPWRRVVDDLRMLPDGTLVGFTFGLPLTSRRGAPFLLHPQGASGGA